MDIEKSDWVDLVHKLSDLSNICMVIYNFSKYMHGVIYFFGNKTNKLNSKEYIFLMQ